MFQRGTFWSALVLALALTAQPAGAQPDKKAAKKGPAVKLEGKYKKGDSFVWTFDMRSDNEVKENNKATVFYVSQTLKMKVTVLTVENGLPGKVRVKFLEHKVDASDFLPIKFTSIFGGHWVEAAVASKWPHPLHVTKKSPDFPEGAESQETLYNLVLLPAPLSGGMVKPGDSWAGTSWYSPRYFKAIFAKDSPVKVSLKEVTQAKVGPLVAVLEVKSSSEEKKSEDGFDAHATGTMERTVRWDLGRGRLQGYGEVSTLVAKAKSKDRTIVSTVKVTIMSNFSYSKTGGSKKHRGK